MIIFNYNEPNTFSNILPLGLVPNTKHNIEKYKKKGERINGRTFIVLEDIKVILSNQKTIIIPKGFSTDLMSIPNWCWSIFHPFDAALIGDLIHDFLYVDKVNQIKFFQNNIYWTMKFADNERNRWRTVIANELPKNNLKIKNYITHKVLNLFAKDFYIRKYEIPN